MNAIVEVTTAEVVVETVDAKVVTTVAFIPKVITPVVTSTVRSLKTLSRGGVSLSAVSPDHILREELALAGV